VSPLKAVRNFAVLIALIAVAGGLWKALSRRPASSSRAVTQQSELITGLLPSRTRTTFDSAKDSTPNTNVASRSVPSSNSGTKNREPAIDTLKSLRVGSSPFVLPDSILATCRDPGIEAGHICERFNAALRAFTEEVRDPVWASETEEKLQAYVEKGFPDATILNIECRTTLCGIEVETANGGIADATFRPYPQPLSSELIREDWMKSLGDTQSGLAIYIVIYRRL
jgi:hypothetical protein